MSSVYCITHFLTKNSDPIFPNKEIRIVFKEHPNLYIECVRGTISLKMHRKPHQDTYGPPPGRSLKGYLQEEALEFYLKVWYSKLQQEASMENNGFSKILIDTARKFVEMKYKNGPQPQNPRAMNEVSQKPLPF